MSALFLTAFTHESATGYPPFGAQVILNGHEWVERQARRQHLEVVKSGNCFVEGSDFAAVIKPLLAGIVRPLGRPPKNPNPLDHHYVALRQELHRTFETIGLVP